MSSQKSNLPLISEIDRTLLKRYNLLSLLKEEKFIESTLALFGSVQDNFGSLSLSEMVNLISNVLNLEPRFTKLRLNPDINLKTYERIISIFSLALIEQLTELKYLSVGKLSPEKPLEEVGPNKSVVIINSRDSTQLAELKNILRELKLSPIIFHEQPIKGRTIVEKLEKYSNVGFAIVILGRDDQTSKNLFRASQNVLVEFGYFMGMLGRDRILVLIQEGVIAPTDIAGICYIPFKDSITDAKDMIKKELQVAGY